VLIPVTGGGPAPSNSGAFDVAWPTAFPIAGVCVPVRVNGTGTWNPHATLATSGFTTPDGFSIAWDNNGVNLTSGLTYYINFTCNTPQ
jgi:hypothetical protein